MTDVKRWRGLKDLVRDAVEQGASAVERVHLATAHRPFSLLAQIPAISEPVRSMQQIHDTLVATTYQTVRTVTRAVGDVAELALDVVESAANSPTKSDSTKRGENKSQS
ncbi:MAG TPA: hypothetical protein VK509_06810 [Polyangiales bacterium]|nr:hypothetical protein [Polyangiales bacterium]